MYYPHNTGEDEDMQDTQGNQQWPYPAAAGFPYSLSDLKYWIIKRTDGTSVKFVLNRDKVEEQKDYSPGLGAQIQKQIPSEASTSMNRSYALSDFCHHTPINPLWVSEDNAVALYVGDAPGAKKEWEKFDFVIDGGDVINLAFRKDAELAGDRKLVELASQYLTGIPETRVLQIDWWDRKAPDLIPAFWTALSKEIKGDVMTCCQGGHGRSGTAFVCLLLNFAPDYDALDAVVHLRAVHCPRAIESKVQHMYINDVASYLGRKPNAGEELDDIKDFKKLFMESTKPTAVRTREWLKW